MRFILSLYYVFKIIVADRSRNEEGELALRRWSVDNAKEGCKTRLDLRLIFIFLNEN